MDKILDQIFNEYKLSIEQVEEKDLQGPFLSTCPDKFSKLSTSPPPLNRARNIIRLLKNGQPSVVVSFRVGTNSGFTRVSNVPIIDSKLWVIDYYCPYDSYELSLLIWFMILTAKERPHYILVAWNNFNAIQTFYNTVFAKSLYLPTDQTLVENVAVEPSNPQIQWLGYNVQTANINKTVNFVVDTYREYEDLEIIEKLSPAGEGKKIEQEIFKMSILNLAPADQIVALRDRFGEQVNHLLALTDSTSDGSGAIITKAMKPNLTAQQRQFIPGAMAELQQLYSQIEKFPLGTLGRDRTLDNMNQTIQSLTKVFAESEASTCQIPAPAIGVPWTLTGTAIGINGVGQQTLQAFVDGKAKAVLLYGPNGGGKTRFMQSFVATMNEFLRSTTESKGKKELAFAFPVNSINNMSPKDLRHLYGCAQLRAREADREALSFVFVDDYQGLLGARGHSSFVGELVRLITSSEFPNVRTIIAGRRPWDYELALLEVIGEQNLIMVDLLTDSERRSRITAALPNQKQELIEFLIAKTGASATGVCLLAQDLSVTDKAYSTRAAAEQARQQAYNELQQRGRIPNDGMTPFGYSSADLKVLLERIKLRLYHKSLNNPANCQKDAKTGEVMGDASVSCQNRIKALEKQLLTVRQRIASGKYADQQLARAQEEDIIRMQKALKLDPNCPPCKGVVEFKDFQVSVSDQLTREDINLALMDVQPAIEKGTPVEEYLWYLRWQRNPLKPALQPIQIACREDTSKQSIRVYRD